jgi:hypothetical protein
LEGTVKPAPITVAIAFAALVCVAAPAQATSLGLAAAAAAWPTPVVEAQGAVQSPRSYGRAQRADTRRVARPRRRDPSPRQIVPPQQARPVEAPRWEPGSGY